MRGGFGWRKRINIWDGRGFSNVNDNFANFSRWFNEPLLELQQVSGAGFIIVMTSLALLERYLREKSGVHERPSLDENFRTEFMRLFPSIGRDDLALKFWEVCRHGLMHQATFKIKTNAGDRVTIGLHESALEIVHRYGSLKDQPVPIIHSRKYHQFLATRDSAVISANYSAVFTSTRRTLHSLILPPVTRPGRVGCFI